MSTPPFNPASTAMTTAHPLLSSNIAVEVLKHLHPGHTENLSTSTSEDDRAVCQRTLAAVAQVCRALSAPALDQLWREVDRLYYLFKLLPSLVVHRNRREHSGPPTYVRWSPH